ncbi:MAG: aspartyl protease family protein [Pseudomonadota bacterium]
MILVFLMNWGFRLKTYQQGLAIAMLVPLLMATSVRAAEPENKCKLLEVENLPLTFTGAAFSPTIPGSINGNPTKVLIDLSSYETSVETAALDAMGIGYRDTFRKVKGIGGNTVAYEVRLDELKAGPAKGKGRFRAYEYATADYGFRVGADFLLRTDLEIALAQKYIKFWSPVDCGQKHLAFWDEDAVVIPFTVHADDDPRPLFKVKINGQEAEAMFSPSTAMSIIDSNLARKIGLAPDSPKLTDAGKTRGIDGSPMKSWMAKIDQLEVGGEMIKNVKIRMLDTGPSVQVILGADFMRAHRILISSKQKLIYLTYTGGEVFPKEAGVNEAWFRAELAAGNPDAQVHMGNAEGDKPAAERDEAKQLAWYQKAAEQGNRSGQIKVGRYKFAKGDFAGGAGDFKLAQARKNSATLSAQLYLASARSGKTAQALEDLKATKLKSSDDWAKNAIDFLLGKIDARELRMKPAIGTWTQNSVACGAEFYIGQSHIIAGQTALARPALEAAVAVCKDDTFESAAARMDLDRLPK